MSVHTASAGIGRAVDPLVVSELRAIVGDRHVLTDPSIIADHLIDWTGRYRAETGVLVTHRRALEPEVAVKPREPAGQAA